MLHPGFKACVAEKSRNLTMFLIDLKLQTVLKWLKLKSKWCAETTSGTCALQISAPFPRMFRTHAEWSYQVHMYLLLSLIYVGDIVVWWLSCVLLITRTHRFKSSHRHWDSEFMSKTHKAQATGQVACRQI